MIKGLHTGSNPVLTTKNKIMKVKIGEKIYDSEKEPIMVILSESDKENISNMLPEATKYCSFPDEILVESIREFMKIS